MNKKQQRDGFYNFFPRSQFLFTLWRFLLALVLTKLYCRFASAVVTFIIQCISRQPFLRHFAYMSWEAGKGRWAILVL